LFIRIGFDFFVGSGIESAGVSEWLARRSWPVLASQGHRAGIRRHICGVALLVVTSQQNDTVGIRDCLIRPAGRIDHQLIAAEKANLDRVVATLGLKEMSQGILVRKLCTLSPHHPTRKAIFEFDKLVRSIYTLRYLQGPAATVRRASFPEPHRVVSSTPRLPRGGQRQKASDGKDGSGRGHQP